MGNYAEKVSNPRQGRLRAAAIALSVPLATLFASGEALAERNFDPRFSQNVQGEITIAANTIMTCPASDTRCPAAQAGTGSTLNNNQFRMVYVDEDGDPATFNSSSADLVLPDGATVLFAGLYFGAKTSAGTGGTQAPSTAARGTVKLKAPGDTSYRSLTAAVDDSTEVARAYGAFADVTAVVQGAGSGSYTVADVQAGTGEDRYGGWSLVVAYRDSAEPARNLTIFDGLNNVTKTKPAITIGVSGFQTPEAGAVKTNLGFVSFEGDRGLGGDTATLNSRVLSTATNPANNFFNSSISKDGIPVTTKQPNYDNQLGYDAVLMNADGYLANGARSAAIRLQTSNETYLPQVISFATELFSPAITATKTVKNVSSPGEQPESGNTLRYTVSYTNTGGDGATQFVAEDPIPVGTSYVPGSLNVTAGPNAGPKSDPLGDDQAEFLSGSNSVRFRLGEGANQTSGGLLSAAGGSAPATTITFDVKVNDAPPLASGTRIVNGATASFLSQTLGTEQSIESNEVVLEVQAPDLVMSKSHADPPPGGPVTFTLGVANEGSAPTDGTVTVDDSFAAPETQGAFSSITFNPDPPTGWDCSATSGLDLSCTRSDELAAGAEYPPIVVEAAVVGSPPAEFRNTAEVTGGGDPNPTNNVAVDYLPAPPATVDLAVTKTVNQATVATGSRVIWTITARNNGPSTATGVLLSDTLPAGANSEVKVTTGQGACEVTGTPEVVCQLDSLAPGTAVTVTVAATVTASTPGTITNTTGIEGVQRDLRPDNNLATASFEPADTGDISIVKTAGPQPTAGQSFTYTLTVTNGGPFTAADMVVNDQIPSLFTPASVAAPSFDCGSSLPPAGGTLECLFNGTLASGSSASIELTGNLSPASAGVPMINTASASSSLADPEPTDNSASVTIVPVPFADLSVSKFASKSKVQPGETFTYTLGVSNRGPVTANPVKVVDTLGNGLEVLTKPSSCKQKGQKLTCKLGKLGVEKSRKLVVKVRARSAITGRNAVNSVRVSAPQPDPVSAGNSDSWRTPVGEQKVKARVSQKVPSKPIPSGRNGKVRIVVKNPSKKAITNARVCQELPRQLVPVKPKKKGLASKSRGKICWKIGTLTPGKKKEYWVTVRAISPRSTRVRVKATLSGGNAGTRSDPGKVRIRPGSAVAPQPVTG